MIGEIISGLMQFAKGAATVQNTYKEFNSAHSRRAIVRFAIYLETLHDQTELLIRYVESVYDGTDGADSRTYPTQTQILQRILAEVTATHAKVAEHFFRFKSNGRSAVVDALAPYAENLRTSGYIASTPSS